MFAEKIKSKSPAIGPATDRSIDRSIYRSMDRSVDPTATHRIALFDLASTPEAEAHGRFATRLARLAPAGATTLIAVDETAFRRRFANDATRLAHRRAVWQAFAQALGSVAVFIDVAKPAPPASAAAEAAAGPAGAQTPAAASWREALRSPVSPDSASATVR